MENVNKGGVSLFSKVSIVINSLLFGITGVIYLVTEEKNNVIGFILLAAGFLNILYIVTTIQTKNLLFVILNFIFSFAALIVAIDYLLKKNNFAIIWVIITLIYLIIGFVVLLRLKKVKEEKTGNRA
jgi:Ca2+/Na+ antiporter